MNCSISILLTPSGARLQLLRTDGRQDIQQPSERCVVLDSVTQQYSQTQSDRMAQALRVHTPQRAYTLGLQISSKDFLLVEVAPAVMMQVLQEFRAEVWPGPSNINHDVPVKLSNVTDKGMFRLSPSFIAGRPPGSVDKLDWSDLFIDAKKLNKSKVKVVLNTVLMSTYDSLMYGIIAPASAVAMTSEKRYILVDTGRAQAAGERLVICWPTTNGWHKMQLPTNYVFQPARTKCSWLDRVIDKGHQIAAAAGRSAAAAAAGSAAGSSVAAAAHTVFGKAGAEPQQQAAAAAAAAAAAGTSAAAATEAPAETAFAAAIEAAPASLPPESPEAAKLSAQEHSLDLQSKAETKQLRALASAPVPSATTAAVGAPATLLPAATAAAQVKGDRCRFKRQRAAVLSPNTCCMIEFSDSDDGDEARQLQTDQQLISQRKQPRTIKQEHPSHCKQLGAESEEAAQPGGISTPAAGNTAPTPTAADVVESDSAMLPPNFTLDSCGRNILAAGEQLTKLLDLLQAPDQQVEQLNVIINRYRTAPVDQVATAGFWYDYSQVQLWANRRKAGRCRAALEQLLANAGNQGSG